MLTFVLPTSIKIGRRCIPINYQLFYRGVNYHVRSKIMSELKKCISLQLNYFEIEEFPVRISYSIVLNKRTIDIDNFSSIIIKAFHDCLVDKGIIPDDSIKYINSIGVSMRNNNGISKDYFEMTVVIK